MNKGLQSEREQEYTLEIKTVPNLPLEIKIDGLNNFKDYNIYLFDAVLKNLYNIKDKQNIEYKSVHQYNPFKLFIGTDNYINEIKKNIMPIAHQLYQNYPNPFNPKNRNKIFSPQDGKDFN